MEGYALVDAPRCGAENMALDQLMLEFAAAQQRPILRVYQWSEPTVSLGYFQKLSDYHNHESNAAPSVVRRTTGGGAIVHHHDWTYSLALPDPAPPGDARKTDARKTDIGAAQPIYDLVHDAVVLWLRGFGWDAAKWQTGCTGNVVSPAACSFLCFERRSRGDVVIGEAKVMGSAQRRMRGAMLQHGSLLLAQSSYAPSLMGLAELSNGQVALDKRGPSLDSQSAIEFLTVLARPVENHVEGRFHYVNSLEGILETCPRAVERFTNAAWLTRV